MKPTSTKQSLKLAAWTSVVFYKCRAEYRERVQAMLDEKSKGQEITITAPEAPQRAQIIDLMQALKQSIEKAKPVRKTARAQRKRKTASSDS